MKIRIQIEIEAIPGPNDSREVLQKAAHSAVYEAMRIHWKGNLQHRRESTFLLADFTISDVVALEQKIEDTMEQTTERSSIDEPPSAEAANDFRRRIGIPSLTN